MRKLLILGLFLAGTLALSSTPGWAWNGAPRVTPPGTFAAPPDPWSHWPPHHFHHRHFKSPDVIFVVPGTTAFLPPPAFWVPAQWVWNGFGWIWVPGHWSR